MKHFVGNISDFTDNKCKKVELGRKKILLWKVNEEIYATQEECPHHGASLCNVVLSGTLVPSAPKDLDYGLDGTVIRCPWHAWEFDVITGQKLYDDDKRTLTIYPVIIEETAVYVEI